MTTSDLPRSPRPATLDAETIKTTLEHLRAKISSDTLLTSPNDFTPRSKPEPVNHGTPFRLQRLFGAYTMPLNAQPSAVTNNEVMASACRRGKLVSNSSVAPPRSRRAVPQTISLPRSSSIPYPIFELKPSSQKRRLVTQGGAVAVFNFQFWWRLFLFERGKGRL